MSLMRNGANPLARALLGLAGLLWVGVPAADPAEGLLWRIEREGVAPSHLFGTVHSDDPRVLLLPTPVRQAFTGADRVVLELVLDGAAAGAMATAMVDRAGPGLRTHLPAQDYARAERALAARGLPAPLVARLKPWAALAALSQPPPRSGLVLDLKLYTEAVQAGRPVFGLESAAEQVEAFESLPQADQIALLRDTVAQLDALPALFEEMIEAWLARDLARLGALADQRSGAVPQEVYERFYAALLDHRNARMAERLAPHLAAGGTFAAVGALHLPGKGGLIERLETAGWRLTREY